MAGRKPWNYRGGCNRNPLALRRRIAGWVVAKKGYSRSILHTKLGMTPKRDNVRVMNPRDRKNWHWWQQAGRIGYKRHSTILNTGLFRRQNLREALGMSVRFTRLHTIRAKNKR